MSILTNDEAVAVMREFTKEGGTFNTRYSDGRWQAQGVRGPTAATGTGESLGDAVKMVCDTLNFDYSEVVNAD